MTDDSQRIDRVIRKHVHDVRNSINSLDLESALLAELTADANVRESLSRMRAELTQLEATIKGFLFKFTRPQPMCLTAGDLLQLWKRQIAPLENASHQIVWSTPPPASDLTIDAHAVVSVLRESVITAWRRAPGCLLKAAVSASAQGVVVELREPLPRMAADAGALDEHRRIVLLNNGTFEMSEDLLTKEQVTTLCFVKER